MRDRLITIWLILMLTIFGVFVNLPDISDLPKTFRPSIGSKTLILDFLAPANLVNRFPLKLGLDLQGGTELVLEAQMDNIPESDRDSALESAREVLERRVNLFGVSEALVQSSKMGSQRRILVELPGVKDLQTATSLIGKTALLEFWELDPTKVPEGTTSASLSDFKATNLSGADLKKSQVTFGSSSKVNSGPGVGIEFTSVGADKFAEITKRNVGKPLLMVLDNSPISWPPPIVQQEILGGNAVISGSFTSQEAKNLSIQLNAGALPVPIKILQQRSIAASLGEASIRKSEIAAVVGIGTVMVYMILFYGIYGVVADIALILYTLIVMSIFRTGLFIIPPVTLTLAGIAGFILSIGMAVDANILTFERMKEERLAGFSGKLSLERGFNRAWTSIRDSNISSLITAMILYIFGTSLVKGFALTLTIGVLVSMFSSIVVTRTLLRLLPHLKK